MNQQSRHTTDDPGSTMDVEVAEILDRYLSARAAGTAPDRETWLKEHPDHAERLAECLDAAELFGGAETGGFDLPRSANLPESIGDFEILGELGRGGMGVVYEAREKSLDRIVALKVMRFGIVDPKALDRFRREAETAGALHHTNIVPVYATGREGDTSWYAMQRIEGESLADRLSQQRENGQLPEIEAVLDVGIQAADALDHAHERDVVHRDVKPANLILDQEDRVWLTDFGLARRLVDAGATVTGAILGTPRYMSPEQADLRTTDVDHRSDIYSLGATLYEMATGRPPFEGDDPLSLITKIRYEDPPNVRSIRPDLPRDLEVVLQKAMEKEPDRRYQSAAEFAEDLRAIREDHPITARPLSILEKTARLARKQQARLRVAASAMLFTVALIAVLLYAMDHLQKERLGSFRIRAGGGPYRATIFPAGESVLSDAAYELTLPMQTHHELVAGDYEMTVAPQGRWSRNHRLPVTKGIPSNYRITDDAGDRVEIEIADAVVVTVADQHGDAILWRKEGMLKKVTLDQSTSWERDVSSIDTPVEDLATDGSGSANESGSANQSIAINFANTRQPSNFHRGQHFLDDNPLFTRGVVALKTPIDLNVDGRSDTLIAAVDHQALLALDHSGEVLWSRAYAFAKLPTKTNVPTPFTRGESIPFPGVFHLQDCGDVNQDGVSDLLAMFVHYQIGATTEVCLATISGASGESLRRQTQSIQSTPNKFWPSDGVFFPRKHQYRTACGLSFTSNHTRRSGYVSLNDFFTRYRANSTPLRIAVPSPPLLIGEQPDTKVVVLAGDQCQIIDWDNTKSADAESSQVTIKLPFVPAKAPIVANANGEPTLIFHDHQESNSNIARFGGTDVMAFGLDGNQRWLRRLEHIEWNNAIDRNHADWPLATDLDGDGNDELVLPRNRYRNGVEVGVKLIDASNGTPLWSPDRPFASLKAAGDAICRIAITEDLDGDGWKDIATATISGSGRFVRNVSVPEREVFVYVDWISGKTGLGLSWARHRIPIVGDRVHVAQIDAIRSQLADAKSGTVEIDLVTGDQTLDVMLSSTVVRFHPENPGPIRMAAGLDVCSPASQANAKPKETERHPAQIGSRSISSTSRPRAYRRRGGPFGVGDDHIVLMRTTIFPPERLGESSALASWTDPLGRSLIAVTGFNPERISVVDSLSRQTVWNSDRVEDEQPSWIPIRRRDGTVDFIQQRQTFIETPPTLIDGDTGTEICRLSNVVGGKLLWTHVLEDDSAAIIVSDGRAERRQSSTFSGKPVHAFQMSRVSLSSGRILWSIPFLHGAARINTPQKYDHLSLADFNGDGIVDIAGPNSHDEQLFFAVWNGENGERLWEVPVYQRPTRTDYWIPYSVVTIDEKPHVAYFGQESEEERDRKLVLVDQNGKPVASQRYDHAAQIPLVSGDYSSRYLAFADLTQSAERPLLGLAHEVRGRYRCSVFDLSAKTFRPHTEFREASGDARVSRVWFRDLDGDGIRERIVIDRLDKQVTDNSDKSNESASLVLRSYSVLNPSPQFEHEIKGAKSLIDCVWQGEHGVPVSWIHIDENRLVGVDWRGKRILTDTKTFPRDPSHLPIVCDRQNDSTMVAFPTHDGIEFESLGNVGVPSDLTFHRYDDPRRTVELFHSIGGHLDQGEWLTRLGICFFAFGVLVLLPFWYVTRTIRERRWSLSWMLLAPALTSLWVAVWQSDWIHDPNLVPNLLNGLSIWLCAVAILIAVRGATDRHGYAVRLMLIVGTPCVFLVIVSLSLLQRTDHSIRYTFGPYDLLRVAFFSFAIVAEIYWLLRLSAAGLSKLRRLLGGPKPA